MNISSLRPFSFFVIFALLPLIIIAIAMSDSTPKPIDSDSSSSSAPAVHIIYTEKPLEEEPESYHIRTLTAVLGRYLFLSIHFHFFMLFQSIFSKIDFTYYNSLACKNICMNSCFYFRSKVFVFVFVFVCII